MNTFKYYILIFFLSQSFTVLAQGKIEKEITVKTHQVPQQARKWLKDAFESVRKPKWYQEFSAQGYSFEAKFKLKKRYYSAEFDSLGSVQDVEVVLGWEELDELVRANLTNYFEETLLAFKLEKIQIQYSGSPDDLEDFFDENESQGILIRYEIEYFAEDQQKVIRLWEGTFSEAGEFLYHRQVEVLEMFNLTF